MLLLLINTSIIWLGSLLAYELLLKSETFHRLNRLYLLLTFIVGIILPLLPFEQAVYVASTGDGLNGTPLSQTSYPSGFPATSHANSDIVAGRTDWWLIVYAAGTIGSLLYLLRDLLRLRMLYQRSTIRREGRWIIAETRGAHSPFSFLHVVFVGSIDQYTDQQWRMVLQHEQQHYRSRHIIDLTLMHLALVVLWFHPLVYIYRNKLRMVHEYEADSVRQCEVLAYGSFLLEQAAFSPAPVLTHSLSFSPLRSRIQMMTKTPGRRLAQCRFLLLLPLMSIFIWCCTKNRAKVAIDISGRVAMLHDAGLGYPLATAPDNVLLNSNTGAGQAPVSVTIVPTPDKLGSQQLATLGDLTTVPQCMRPGTGFGIRYILEKADLTPTLEKMNDGAYYIAVSDIIINCSGHVVYYMLTGPENDTEASLDPGGFYVAKPNGLKKADMEALQKKIAGVLIGGDIAFTPAKNRQGSEVPYILASGHHKTASGLQTTLIVKNHRITFPKQDI